MTNSIYADVDDNCKSYYNTLIKTKNAQMLRNQELIVYFHKDHL